VKIENKNRQMVISNSEQINAIVQIKKKGKKER